MIHSVVAVSGTGSGTHISLARLRQITLNCGDQRIYLYAKFPQITLIYHRLTVFSGNSKSAEGNLVGVRPPPGTIQNKFLTDLPNRDDERLEG
jgi:hypothetical protein